MSRPGPFTVILLLIVAYRVFVITPPLISNSTSAGTLLTPTSMYCEFIEPPRWQTLTTDPVAVPNLGFPENVQSPEFFSIVTPPLVTFPTYKYLAVNVLPPSQTSLPLLRFAVPLRFRVVPSRQRYAVLFVSAKYKFCPLKVPPRNIAPALPSLLPIYVVFGIFSDALFWNTNGSSSEPTCTHIVDRVSSVAALIVANRFHVPLILLLNQIWPEPFPLQLPAVDQLGSDFSYFLSPND